MRNTIVNSCAYLKPHNLAPHFEAYERPEVCFTMVKTYLTYVIYKRKPSLEGCLRNKNICRTYNFIFPERKIHNATKVTELQLYIHCDLDLINSEFFFISHLF